MVLQAGFIVPGIVGPLVCILLFVFYSNVWEIAEMRVLLVVGLACEIPAAIGMFFVKDVPEAFPEASMPIPADQRTPSLSRISNESEESSESIVEDPRAIPSKSALFSTTGEKAEALPGMGKWCCFTAASIPYLLFAGDLVTALGSGMTIKFFPLFFKDDMHLAPAQVYAIWAGNSLSNVLVGLLAQRMSTCFGRVQTMAVCRFIGISLLVGMAVLYFNNERRWYVIVPMYVLRTGLMNGTYPLEESILMDFVPKNTRARWKSLESVVSIGWAGSAALGGLIADKYNYTTTFFFTAAFQAAGSLVLIPLMAVVPRFEDPSRTTDDSYRSAHGGEENIYDSYTHGTDTSTDETNPSNADQYG
jgi:MFS family permease